MSHISTIVADDVFVSSPTRTPICASSRYRLIYAQAPFAQHTSFLQGLRTRHPTVIIPFLDALDLPDEVRETVDQYLYVLDDADASKVVAAVKAAASRGRAFPARMEELGVVSGSDVAEMLSRFSADNEGEAEVGRWYRIQSGGYRNLIVRMTDRDPSDERIPVNRPQLDSPPTPGERTGRVTVEYHDIIAGQYRPIVVAKANLAPTRTPVPVESAFTNYLATAKTKRAVILDADTELREACCRVDNLYTRPDSREVRDAIAAGLEPPAWGRYVGGAQGQYFTISRFRAFYAEYELHVVFDERPGGPRAGHGSDNFRRAFQENREWAKRYAKSSGLHVYELPGQRAEDVIGSLVKRMEGDLGYSEIVIATKGTDLYPLVSAKTRLTLPKLNFRDHPQTVLVRDALDKFGLSDPAHLKRIYWLRAINGDVGGTPSVNLYNKQSGHRYTSIRREDYLPHVLAAADLSDLKLRLLAFEAFHPFIHAGQFDRNLAEISLKTTLLDRTRSLSRFRKETEDGIGRIDIPAIRKLLEENSFYKEIEYLEWQVRVTKGLW